MNKMLTVEPTIPEGTLLGTKSNWIKTNYTNYSAISIAKENYPKKITKVNVVEDIWKKEMLINNWTCSNNSENFKIWQLVPPILKLLCLI